jgi:F-type H+-transporting ATPase subunit delta
MKKRAVKKYAKALFDIAKEEKLTDELFRGLMELEKILDEEIAEFLSSPVVRFEDKLNFLKGLEERLGLHPFITNTLIVLIERDRGRLIPALPSYYAQLYMEDKGYVVAEVKTARELNDSEEEILKKKISEWAGREVFLKKEVEKELIGGIIIKIGDLLIDNSILKKIRSFAEQFKGERK